MNKVYFDKNEKKWIVKELQDIYLFKTVNSSNGEEVNQILSWTRGFDMTDYPNHIRMYDIEIDNVRYFFLMSRNGNSDRFVIESEDPILLKRSNLFFTGEDL
jgi:hypothetical protein